MFATKQHNEKGGRQERSIRDVGPRTSFKYITHALWLHEIFTLFVRRRRTCTSLKARAEVILLGRIVAQDNAMFCKKQHK